MEKTESKIGKTNTSKKTDFKKALKDFWDFVWHSNSVWSWIVNIILAFVIIKFIVYPVLGVVLGSPVPIVAVVSGSMEHDGSLDDWFDSLSCCSDSACSKRFSQSKIYDDYGLEKNDFKDFKFTNGFNKGDIMILKSAKDVQVGDVIVFNVDSISDPIIHRVVSLDGGIATKGDHNCGSANFEKNIPEQKIIGKAIGRVPLLGWIKIGFVEVIKLFRGA